MRLPKITLFSLCLVLFMSFLSYSPSYAQWNGDVEISYLQTSGNTENMSLSGTVKAHREFSNSKVFMEFRTLYSEQNSLVSSKRWMSKLKVDRNIPFRRLFVLVPAFWVYGIGMIEQDELKGIERRVSLQTGVGRYLVQTEQNNLKVEIGAGYIIENRVSGQTSRSPSGVGFLGFVHTFSEKTRFEQKMELILNLSEGEAYLFNAEAAFITGLIGSLALKVSLGINYDNLPPIGFKSTDRLYKTSLLMTF